MPDALDLTPRTLDLFGVVSHRGKRYIWLMGRKIFDPRIRRSGGGNVQLPLTLGAYLYGGPGDDATIPLPRLRPHRHLQHNQGDGEGHNRVIMLCKDAKTGFRREVRRCQKNRAQLSVVRASSMSPEPKSRVPAGSAMNSSNIDMGTSWTSGIRCNTSSREGLRGDGVGCVVAGTQLGQRIGKFVPS